MSDPLSAVFGLPAACETCGEETDLLDRVRQGKELAGIWLQSAHKTPGISSGVAALAAFHLASTLIANQIDRDQEPEAAIQQVALREFLRNFDLNPPGQVEDLCGLMQRFLAGFDRALADHPRGRCRCGSKDSVGASACAWGAEGPLGSAADAPFVFYEWLRACKPPGVGTGGIILTALWGAGRVVSTLAETRPEVLREIESGIAPWLPEGAAGKILAVVAEIGRRIDVVSELDLGLDEDEEGVN